MTTLRQSRSQNCAYDVFLQFKGRSLPFEPTMVDPVRVPRPGERTADFQHGYGRCQCGCGGLVDGTDASGLFVRFIRDHDAVAVSRRGSLEDGARRVDGRPFLSGAALDRRATEPMTPARQGAVPHAGILAGRYTSRRTPEPGRRETDRLVDMFADQTHARQQLQVKLGILESEVEFAIKYLRVFCSAQKEVGDALITRLETALRTVRQDVP